MGDHRCAKVSKTSLKVSTKLKKLKFFNTGFKEKVGFWNIVEVRRWIFFGIFLGDSVREKVGAVFKMLRVAYYFKSQEKNNL